MAQTATIFMGRGIQKTLTLELSNGEGIFACIRQGMLENNIRKAEVTAIEGAIAHGTINYMAGCFYKSREIKNAEVIRAHGKYELKGNAKNLFGNLHIAIDISGRPTTVTLVEGSASGGLKARMSFIDIAERTQ